MKKSALLLGVLVAMPAFAGDDYGYRYSSSCTDCGYETTRTVRSNSYKKASRKTSGYKNTITNNFYYIQPGAARTDYRAQNYYTPKPDYSNSYQEPVQEETSYTKKSYSSKMRKYFLAHPFFQPEQGQFGSVTDVSYATNSFKFDTIDGTVYNLDTTSGSYNDPNNPIHGDSYLSGKAETTQFTVKEDISYGISNNLSLLAMAQYDSTEVKIKDWKDRLDSSWSSVIKLILIQVLIFLVLVCNIVLLMIQNGLQWLLDIINIKKIQLILLLVKSKRDIKLTEQHYMV